MVGSSMARAGEAAKAGAPLSGIREPLSLKPQRSLPIHPALLPSASCASSAEYHLPGEADRPGRLGGAASFEIEPTTVHAVEKEEAEVLRAGVYLHVSQPNSPSNAGGGSSDLATASGSSISSAMSGKTSSVLIELEQIHFGPASPTSRTYDATTDKFTIARRETTMTARSDSNDTAPSKHSTPPSPSASAGPSSRTSSPTPRRVSPTSPGVARPSSRASSMQMAPQSAVAVTATAAAAGE